MTSAKYCLVDHAEWNEEQIYRAALRSVKTGEVWHEEAELHTFVCITGTLDLPTFPRALEGENVSMVRCFILHDSVTIYPSVRKELA